jgi:putative flippase GtrA
MSLTRQFSAFAIVGLFAAVAHYGALVALVEGFAWGAVPATLVGYVAGGIVSYILNRRHTFASDRPHEEATWRFAAVAGVGFCLTWICMEILNGRLGVQYLLAQIVTTGVVLLWSFSANKFWTFGTGGPAGPPIP